MSTVSPDQRFTSGNPCPICGGHKDARSGSGNRCWGFVMDDGRAVVCTSVESEIEAGGAEGWVHRIDEDGAPRTAVTISGSEMYGRETIERLALSKGLPVEAFTNLGCKEIGSGVRIGGKIRKRGDQKYAWISGRSPKTDPLFPPLPDDVPKAIWLTAGETDAITARHLGVAAFGITHGEQGSGALTTAHYHALAARGVSEVTIVGDGDAKGQAWMRAAAASAASAGLRVTTVNLAAFYDPFGSGCKDLNEIYQRYGDETLSVLAAHTQTTEAVPYLSTSADVLAWADEPEDWLIENLIARGTKTMLSAPAKSLKTYLNLHLVACCATCTPFLDRVEWQVPSPVRVLVVEEEGARQMFGRRWRRVLNGIEGNVEAPPLFKFRHGFNLLDEDQVEALIAHVRESEIDLLILDPLQRITPGVDENSNSDMRRVWDAVNRVLLAVPGIAVLVTAHNRKGDALRWDANRGASISAGEQDLGIFLEKLDDFTRDEVADTYSGTVALVLDGRELPQTTTKDGAMQVEYRFDYAADAFTMRDTGALVAPQITKRSAAGRAALELLTANRGKWLTTSTIHHVVKEQGIEITRDGLLKQLSKFNGVEEQGGTGKEKEWRLA